MGGLTGAGLAVAVQAAKANNRRDDTIVLIVAEKVEVLWLFCKWNGEMTYCLQQQHVISILRKKKLSRVTDTFINRPPRRRKIRDEIYEQLLCFIKSHLFASLFLSLSLSLSLSLEKRSNNSDCLSDPSPLERRLIS